MKYIVINHGINLHVRGYHLPITDMVAEWGYWQNEVIAASSFEFFCSNQFYNILKENNLANDIEFHTIEISKDYEEGWEGKNIVLPKFYYMKPRGIIGKSEIIQMGLNLYISENVFELTKHLFNNIVEFKPFIGEINFGISDKIELASFKSFYKINIEKNCKKVGENIYFKTNRVSFFKNTKNHICITLGDESMQNEIEKPMLIFSVDIMREIANFENIKDLEYKEIEFVYEPGVEKNEIEYYLSQNGFNSFLVQNNELYIQTELYPKVEHLLSESSIEYVLNIESFNDDLKRFQGSNFYFLE
jgi:hypothetical protein